MKQLSLVLSLFVTTLISSAQTTPDPATTGPYAVTKAVYNLGDLAWFTPTFPDSLEVAGSVHYPTSLTGGPFPVLFFLHGRHETCYETSNPSNSNSNWPCGTGFSSIVSYDGYDYLAQVMASHGYIVVSVSANAINANDASTSDAGMGGRAALMQYHCDLWNTFNTTGGAPFGTMFIGQLNMNNIGTMGHSRGGEGVVRHALLNRSLGSPYGINAVLTLAPVDFDRYVLNGIPLMNVAPYCDGDVSDLQGVHFYDDARYLDSTDETPKHSVAMMGANHNFFNTVWTPGSFPGGTADDWDDVYGSSVSFCGTASTNSGRFSKAKQKAVLTAYLCAFFRVYIGGENVFKPILETEDLIPPVSTTADSNEVFVSYHPPRSLQLNINKTNLEIRETTNSLLAPVNSNSLTKLDVCADDAGEADCGVSTFQSKEPHSGSSSALGMGQLAIAWDANTDWVENELPISNADISGFGYLQFRAGVDFSNSTSGTDIDFTVQIIDTSGAISSIDATNYTNALYYPPGSQFLELPKVLFHTIKIPLSDFIGINLSAIKSIRFLFDKNPSGNILATDLMVSGTATIPTSVATNTINNYIRVYPNPTDGVLTIDTRQSSSAITGIDMIDLGGKIIYSEQLAKQQLISINISSLEKGVYLLRMNTNEGEKVCKIIKQ